MNISESGMLSSNIVRRRRSEDMSKDNERDTLGAPTLQQERERESTTSRLRTNARVFVRMRSSNTLEALSLEEVKALEALERKHVCIGVNA